MNRVGVFKQYDNMSSPGYGLSERLYSEKNVHSAAEFATLLLVVGPVTRSITAAIVEGVSRHRQQKCQLTGSPYRPDPGPAYF